MGDRRAVWAIQTPWNGSEDANRCSSGWGEPTLSTLATPDQWVNTRDKFKNYTLEVKPFTDILKIS